MLQFNTYYHIYNHANGDDNLFREQKNYPFFLEKYHKHINPIAETIAWCLMPNHFHLLVKIRSEAEVFDNFNLSTSSSSSKVMNFGRAKEEDNEEYKRKLLSKQFANFFSSYTQAFNKVYHRRGSLFIKNFKRKEILDEKYLLNLILYIHLNPEKHGFCQGFENWEHSSYQLFPKAQPQILNHLFDELENFKQLHSIKSKQFKEYQAIENDLK